MRTPGLAPMNPLNSLQVGSHLPPPTLQHRNSFCVSALLSHQSLYSPPGHPSYSSPLTCATAASAADPFTFPHPHRMHFDELPPVEVCFLFNDLNFLFFLIEMILILIDW